MRFSPWRSCSLGFFVATAGCAATRDDPTGSAWNKPVDGLEIPEGTEHEDGAALVPVGGEGPSSNEPRPACSRCIQACRITLRGCRYVRDSASPGAEGHLRCELDRHACASLCRPVCR